MNNLPKPTRADPDGADTDWPRGVGFIYLGISPWEGMWKNRHQLMSRFAGELPVLYVEPWRRLRLRSLPGARPSPRRLWRELRTPSLTIREGGVRVLDSPSYVPVSGTSWVRRATVGAWLWRLRLAARSVGIRRPILWVSHPEMLEVVGRMQEILSVYHIVDEYAGYTGARRLDELRAREERLLDRVDLSIAVTPELIAAREGAARRLLLVENAVDFERFSGAAAEAAGHDPLAGIQRPRYGYSGLIGARLDLELLLEFARSAPESSLVLAGKVDARGCEDALASLRALPNVHFLGELPASSVARHVAAFDVGLLPYRINRETTHISPLKLYEYLAAGKPVIATPIPAAQRYGDLVEIAPTAAAFLLAGRALLDRDDDRIRARRRNFAAGNTWDHRVRQIRAALVSLLDGDGRGFAGDTAET